MAIRKIELMHREFGFSPGNKCRTCDNFIHGRYHTKMLSKCAVYGLTHSEASDWSGRYDACGMYNRVWNGNPIIRLVRGAPKENDPIEEQACFAEMFTPNGDEPCITVKDTPFPSEPRLGDLIIKEDNP